MTDPQRSAAQGVTAVCVTYQPDRTQLQKALETVMAQVDRLIVVDNSDHEDQRAAVAELASRVGASHLKLANNPGLAAGLNAGIRLALEDAGCAQVLLLDQDSLPAQDMVVRLLAAERSLCAARPYRVAAVGPHYVDPRADRVTTYPRFLRFPPSRVVPAQEPNAFAVDMLISSGCLIPRAALDEVGLMDEGLFIDHVDTDWCLRARAHGLELFVVQDAGMEHRLGERWVRLGPLRSLPVHAPERMYYLFRNSLLLYRRPHASWPWILSDLRRLAAMLTVNVLASGHAVTAFTHALAGIAAGLIDRHGKRS